MSQPEVSIDLDGPGGRVDGDVQQAERGRRRHRFSQRPWWRDSLLRRMLAVADLAAAGLATLSLAAFASPRDALWALLVLPGWILLAKLQGLYDRDQRAMRHLTVDELPRIALWSVIGTTGTSVLLSLTPPGGESMGAAVQACVVACLAGFALRSAARLVWRKLTPPERTLIVGSGALAEAARRKIELFPDMHLRLVPGGPQEPHEPIDASVVDRIVLASQTIDEAVLAELLADCRKSRTKLSVIPPIRGMLGTAVSLDHVADLPVVQYNTWDVSRSTLLLKRALDVAIAVPALVVAMPLLVGVAIAVRLDSPGPVVFSQRRAGLRGRPFRMLKFRTMVWNAEDLLTDLVTLDALSEPMFKLREDPRVTRVGRFLRRTSLDELPQLFNVAKGDMSLVGPRPEQLELVERYRPDERFRLAVKPGLTGPMQVYGRGQLSFEERLAVERDYIENLSLGRDLRILALTIAPLATGKGAF
jgi:exopolysaccharide biosynthesis polyprenyl glycosylphosphotransferase